MCNSFWKRRSSSVAPEQHSGGLRSISQMLFHWKQMPEQTRRQRAKSRWYPKQVCAGAFSSGSRKSRGDKREADTKNKTWSRGHIHPAWQTGLVASLITPVPAALCAFSTEFKIKKGFPLTTGSPRSWATSALGGFIPVESLLCLWCLVCLRLREDTSALPVPSCPSS